MMIITYLTQYSGRKYIKASTSGRRVGVVGYIKKSDRSLYMMIILIIYNLFLLKIVIIIYNLPYSIFWGKIYKSINERTGVGVVI